MCDIPYNHKWAHKFLRGLIRNFLGTKKCTHFSEKSLANSSSSKKFLGGPSSFFIPIFRSIYEKSNMQSKSFNKKYFCTKLYLVFFITIHSQSKFVQLSKTRCQICSRRNQWAFVQFQLQLENFLPNLSTKPVRHCSVGSKRLESFGSIPVAFDTFDFKFKFRWLSGLFC